MKTIILFVAVVCGTAVGIVADNNDDGAHHAVHAKGVANRRMLITKNEVRDDHYLWTDNSSYILLILQFVLLIILMQYICIISVSLLLFMIGHCPIDQ